MNILYKLLGYCKLWYCAKSFKFWNNQLIIFYKGVSEYIVIVVWNVIIMIYIPI